MSNKPWLILLGAPLFLVGRLLLDKCKLCGERTWNLDRHVHIEHAEVKL